MRHVPLSSPKWQSLKDSGSSVASKVQPPRSRALKAAQKRGLAMRAVVAPSGGAGASRCAGSWFAAVLRCFPALFGFSLLVVGLGSEDARANTGSDPAVEGGSPQKPELEAGEAKAIADNPV